MKLKDALKDLSQLRGVPCIDTVLEFFEDCDAFGPVAYNMFDDGFNSDFLIYEHELYDSDYTILDRLYAIDLEREYDC